MSKLLLPNLSYKIMGIMFDIHNELGQSLLEKHYQRAIEKALKLDNMRFKREEPVDILYNDEKIGKYYVDFIVQDLIILEIKAQANYSPKFFRQALSYLKQLNLPLAIVINFKGDKIRYKRIVNPNFKDFDLSDVDLKYK